MTRAQYGETIAMVADAMVRTEWMRCAGIARVTGKSSNSVAGALRQLVKRGDAESRKVGMGGIVEYRLIDSRPVVAPLPAAVEPAPVFLMPWPPGPALDLFAADNLQQWRGAA